MIKLLEISKSWITAFNPSPEQKEIAESRLEICNDCEYKKYLKIINSFICDRCNCPLQGKIFAPTKESCPEKKWLK